MSTTPGERKNLVESINSGILGSLKTSLPACSLEAFPSSPHYAVCGTYKLEEGEKNEAIGSGRSGELLVVKTIMSPGSRSDLDSDSDQQQEEGRQLKVTTDKNELPIHLKARGWENSSNSKLNLFDEGKSKEPPNQYCNCNDYGIELERTINIGSGILDMQWKEVEGSNQSYLACALSSGQLRIFRAETEYQNQSEQSEFDVNKDQDENKFKYLSLQDTNDDNDNNSNDNNNSNNQTEKGPRINEVASAKEKERRSKAKENFSCEDKFISEKPDSEEEKGILFLALDWNRAKVEVDNNRIKGAVEQTNINNNSVNKHEPFDHSVHSEDDVKFSVEKVMKSMNFCRDANTSPNMSEEILVGQSNGCVSLWSLTPHDGLQNRITYLAHEYYSLPIEVWSVAFDCNQRYIHYSGGDDSIFKQWDQRLLPIQPMPINIKSNEDENVSTFSSESPAKASPVGMIKNGHQMGVTVITTSSFYPYQVITGSYDEHVRIWDTRMHFNDKTNMLPLGSVNVGGGIWRLKWHPEIPNQLLVAAMHGGAAILNIDSLTTTSSSSSMSSDILLDGKIKQSIICPSDASDKKEESKFKTTNKNPTPLIPQREFHEHQSMVYGATWTSPQYTYTKSLSLGSHEYEYADSKRNYFPLTCSFYDKIIHLWK